MRIQCIHRCCGALLAAILSWPLAGLTVVVAAQSQPAVATASASVPLAAMAEYHRLLEVYSAARRKYESAADAYWHAIADKRRMRNAKRHAGKEILLEDYVLTQPPVYAGPPQPADPSAPPDDEPPPRAYVPVVAAFLQAAGKHFNFVPQRPQSRSSTNAATPRSRPRPA